VSDTEAADAPLRDADFDAMVLDALPHVVRFARSLAHDEALADDLVQETYLRAYRSWHTFQRGADARRWLFTICRNVYLRLREREARVVDTSGEDAELESLAAAIEHGQAERGGLGDLLDRIEVAPAIRAALAAVPEVYRTAAILVDVEGESYEAAAEVLGVPVGTVRSRLFRARRLLQQSLFKYAVDAGIVRDSAPPGSGAGQ
jgi:RNA polymerase sigma-70 factor (ECF subfamily)